MTSSCTVSERRPEFSVRMVVCDYYLTKPTPGLDVTYSEFRGTDIKQVPVLRIFGPTSDGRKACLHVHGVFPYFYIPCHLPSPEPQFLYHVATSLDKALNIALKQATSASQHIYKISLVRGLPFYGFHYKDHLYLKIFLYNPLLIKQAVELCSNGAILGQTFQPHESHLNFTLQFFIDFNLFGMSNVDLQSVKYRKSGISQNSNEPVQGTDEFNLKPESVCYYEADCIASHIINRQRIGKGNGIENPGLEEVWNQEMERRKQLNMSMASKSLSQGRINEDETESHYKFKEMFLIKISDLIEKPVNPTEIKKIENEIYYPAESMDGSQLIDTVDVSIHIPENTFGNSLNKSLKRDLDESLTEYVDHTVVDESIALNSSLSIHYSQVLLDSEDLELVDMLQDMDEKSIEEDSVMATPTEADRESDDVEYSQVFNEETILVKTFKSKEDVDETSPIWNDSFWISPNIPQLDGACDDDHVKKVRKRKMRSLRLGLPKPTSKKFIPNHNDGELEAINNGSDLDEINVSRDIISNTSALHFKKVLKREYERLPDNSKNINIEESNNTFGAENRSTVNLIDEKTHNKSDLARSYDLHNCIEPIAGPSSHYEKVKDIEIENCSINNSYESIDDKSGIISFYDSSKIFDLSLQNEVENDDRLQRNIKEDNKNLNEDNRKPQLDFRESRFITGMDNCVNENTLILSPIIKPPTKNDIVSTLDKYKIPRTKNSEPYYSDHKDVGDKVEIGQMLIKLKSRLSCDQRPFEKVLNTTSIEEWRQLLFIQTNESNDTSKPESLKILLAGNKRCILEPVKKPPTRNGVLEWLQQKVTATMSENNNKEVDKEISIDVDEIDNSQTIGLREDQINRSISLESNEKEKTKLDNTLQVTMQPDGSFLCFETEHTPNENSIDVLKVNVDFLTVMLIEVHTKVRGELNPDPLIDPIEAVFYTVTNDCPSEHFLVKSNTQIIVGETTTSPKRLDRCVFNTPVIYVNNENDILEKVIELVKKHDPDIICGYEIEMNSWGYILERSQVLGLEMVKEISRITEKHRQKRWINDENEFEGRIIGRIMLNVWRLFRYELALSSYSFENCMHEVLNERVPKYSYAQLSKWWSDESRLLRWVTVEYYLTRLSGTVRMLEKLDIINRTSELARLFGMQWWEVLSRGSQFRVESLMLRAARPLNLVALSPTVKQRAAMRAPECLPLIFEPESRFYSDPVIVLDFQSLYPSMMIAYNYCFSTCIGRVQNISGDSAYEFGAWHLRIPKSKLEALVKKDLVHWSPVGVGFVKTSVRRGVLPALLRRILAARQAVKKSMKLQTDEAVKKAMHSRQLGLKLIANVTYGYTAANFSGRMPCVEVGDSVVAKGRETLERAIKLVKNNTQWNVKVVYGDTDSMFVLVPGATRSEAFAVGQQIADAVTADNPSPVALKLEKVYQPCILQTKKRYVGYMYESPDQEKPVYEAKGIETVRRDGCPAGVKLLKQCLCELFESGDMSRVKRLVTATLSRLTDSNMPAHDLFFTREYHGPSGYRPGAAAPPNEIAKRLSARDRRALPRTGERVVWQVCAGAPDTPLVKLARAPSELVRDPALRPHLAYYIARIILPPLHRCLSLLGVNVFKWWSELGYSRCGQTTEVNARGGIARYMCRERCAACGARGARALCVACAARPRAAAVLAARQAVAVTHRQHCYEICASCCGHNQSEYCENTECPVLWRRLTAQQRLAQVCDLIAHLPPHLADHF